MKERGYSLVEVVVAAAVAAIGVAAGAVMMNTLVIQEEQNAGAVRAANLHEQATMLYRLGLTNPTEIYGILPEACSVAGTPAVGEFSIVFGDPATATSDAVLDGGDTVAVAYTMASCTLVYANRVAGSGEVTYLTNSLNIVRPTIRVGP
jgi:prepilin-type N-terminal cleavage/methylation domain-containing protein